MIAAVDNHLGMEALYEQKAGIILADKLLTQTMQKGVSENHIHFNAGFDYEILWLRRMDIRFINNVSISKAAILEWIDKVRQYGMEASFVQTIKSAEQIYIDINTILKAIEHIRHRRQI